MASITKRRTDDATKARLRVSAAKHGQSMEAEARDILKCARFAPLGRLELPEIPREPGANRRVSESTKLRPAPEVRRWMAAHPPEHLFITTVTQAENPVWS